MTRKRRWRYHFLITAGLKRLPIFIYLSVWKVWFSGWFISLGWQGSPIKNKVLLRHVPWWWSGILGKMLCREIEHCQLLIIQDPWLKVTNRNILFGSKEHLTHFRIRVILITISAGIISCAGWVPSDPVVPFTALELDPRKHCFETLNGCGASVGISFEKNHLISIKWLYSVLSCSWQKKPILPPKESYPIWHSLRSRSFKKGNMLPLG